MQCNAASLYLLFPCFLPRLRGEYLTFSHKYLIHSGGRKKKKGGGGGGEEKNKKERNSLEKVTVQ